MLGVHILTIILASQPSFAYFLMAANNVLTTQRMDPLVNPGSVSTHVHAVVGGSNFSLNTNTSMLRSSQCNSIPIVQDKSNYWYPQLYFQWKNGSFTSIPGNPVIQHLDYLFSDSSGPTTAFPDDFRMISGNPALRTLDPSSFAQQAVTYMCLDFNGKATKFNELPNVHCPSGIRSQINFPSCWDGKNLDSSDHKSHVAFPSTGPDNGTCSDPAFPVTLPRIFLEVYWITQDYDSQRPHAFTHSQPMVFSNGDPTGYGFHADFINGWDPGVLQKVLDAGACSPFGDATCYASKGLFTIDQSSKCFITDTVNETTLGTLPKLPGANPVQAPCFETYQETEKPAIFTPVYAYTDESNPPPNGTSVAPATAVSSTQSPAGTCLWKGEGIVARAELRWIVLCVLVITAHLLR